MTVETGRHAGRCALVTGGSKGIGRAIVERFAAEGAMVAFCGRGEEAVAGTRDALTAAGAEVHACVADVTVADDVERLVAETVARFGRLDYVVNNAGGAQAGDFFTLTDEAWQRDFDTKVMSMVRVTRAAVPHLRESDRARVVNIGAVYGRHPDPRFFATSTLRAACLSFTKTLAIQLAPLGILVNILNIGYVTTPQWENIRNRLAPDEPLAEFTTALAADVVPLGRFGRADEVAPLVSFLCGDEASYLTGTSIDVAGGMGRYV